MHCLGRSLVRLVVTTALLSACDGGDIHGLPPHGEEIDPDEPMVDGGAPDPTPCAVDSSCDSPGAVARFEAVRLPRVPDPGIEPHPLPTCADVDDRLRDDFGFVLQPGTLSFGGLAPTDIGCEDRIKLYRMFVAPFEHDGYRHRLDPERLITFHLYRSDDPRSGSCSGSVPSARAIQIRDLAMCLRNVTDVEDRRFRSTAMFLIHESGHVLANRNDGIKAEFRAAGLPELDPDCYDGGFLKTYYYRSGVNPVSESFAEAIALYIGRRKVGRHATIEDFETECPNTHAWIRTAVFDYRP
jgi:hypothetical protein